MHCLKVVVVQNPFFSASSRVYFLHPALSVLESNLRWYSANLRMLARHVRSSLCPRISHRGLPTICPAPSQSSIQPSTLDREPHSWIIPSSQPPPSLFYAQIHSDLSMKLCLTHVVSPRPLNENHSKSIQSQLESRSRAWSESSWWNKWGRVEAINLGRQSNKLNKSGQQLRNKLNSSSSKVCYRWNPRPPSLQDIFQIASRLPVGILLSLLSLQLTQIPNSNNS